MHNISDKCDSQIVDPIAILYGITEYIRKTAYWSSRKIKY
jgi:hypothetical protein